MTRYKIIANPIAGKGTCLKVITPIMERLKSLNLDTELTMTERPMHAYELAQEACRNGFDVVVAVGGDGTCNEVLNGLVKAKQEKHHDAAMGVLAVGRGNDFAYSMRIPSNWEDGCESLSKNIQKTIDVGKTAADEDQVGRYVGNGVGIGFDTIVGFEAAKLPISGTLAYLVAAIKTIFLYFHAPLLRIELDDETLEQPCLMVSVMNGRRMGGSFYMAPQSVPDDQLFDLCIVGAVSRLGVFGLMPKFFNGSQYTNPAVKHKRSKTVKITALNGSLPAHGDGETICTAGHQLTVNMSDIKINLIINPEL